MKTTDETYIALQRSESVQGRGRLRGQMKPSEMREAISALASIVFVLAEHVEGTASDHTDAILRARQVAREISDDLME